MIDSTIGFLSVLFCIYPYLPDNASEDMAFAPFDNR